MPGRVTPQITVQAGRVAAWWARVIRVRGRRSSPQRDPPRLRWPGSPGRWRRRLCPAAQTRRQRPRLLAKPGRPWRSANESGCPWRDGPACRPPWREVILACRPWRGDMTGIPELPGSLTRHGWARFRGSARRVSSFSGRWAAYLLPCQEITGALLKMVEQLANPWVSSVDLPARWWAITSAWIPPESQNVMAVISATRRGSLRTDRYANELQLELQLRMTYGAGAEQSCGRSGAANKQVLLRHAWLFHRPCGAIFACLPGRRHRCQTDLVLSPQGEEVFPSPVSPM